MADFKNMNKDEDKEKDKKKYTTMNLRVPTALINEVDQFTEDYNFMNRTDAVRFLISKGLKDFQPDK
ncbi:ribbon-helix-helix domain-containing protein [Sporosarcina sp. BP05]|uniref:ribbon-helix-helix domain-containing protein n=1 Tax=Sporosarcina sp. BP05 TaxID=2758726 RepID=UPI0016446DF3|nr:ribbon-helix-helix domain-containing protein [Sporosarcina sp. BP05]